MYEADLQTKAAVADNVIVEEVRHKQTSTDSVHWQITSAYVVCALHSTTSSIRSSSDMSPTCLTKPRLAGVAVPHNETESSVMLDDIDEGQRIQKDVSEDPNFSDFDDWFHEPPSKGNQAPVPNIDDSHAFVDGLFETPERPTHPVASGDGCSANAETVQGQPAEDLTHAESPDFSDFMDYFDRSESLDHGAYSTHHLHYVDNYLILTEICR